MLKRCRDAYIYGDVCEAYVIPLLFGLFGSFFSRFTIPTLIRPVASCFGVVRPYNRGCEAADCIPACSAEFF